MHIIFRYGLFIPKKSDSNKVQLQHKPSIFGDDSDDEVRTSVLLTVTHAAHNYHQISNLNY